jgi:hypothetical protein
VAPGRAPSGSAPAPPPAPLEGWAWVGPRGETWPHWTLWVGEPIPYRRTRAIHVDRVLEALLPDDARDFLGRLRDAPLRG